MTENKNITITATPAFKINIEYVPMESIYSAIVSSQMGLIKVKTTA